MSNALPRCSRYRAVAAAIAITAASAAQLGAQSESAIAGALGVVLTPTGNVASVAPQALGQEQSRSIGFTYGRRKDIVNVYALSGDFGPLRLQAGVADLVEDDEQVIMLGAGYAATMYRSQPAGGPVASFGVSGEAGYGRISEEDESLNAYSVGLKLPLALTMEGTGFAVTPYIAPGAFFGGISGAGESESGTRATANAGVQFALPVARIELGAHKVFISDSEITWGLGISLSWR